MIEKINNAFHLSGKDISYVISITESGEAVQSYFGKKIRMNQNYRSELMLDGMAWTPMINNDVTFEMEMTEYTSYGYGDLHTPMYQAENKDGNYISHLLYKTNY